MIASPPKQLTTIRSKYSHRCVVYSAFTRSIKYCVVFNSVFYLFTYQLHTTCCPCSVFYEVAKVPALSEESHKSWDWPFPCDEQAYPHPLQNMLRDSHKTIQWSGCLLLFLKSICAEKNQSIDVMQELCVLAGIASPTLDRFFLLPIPLSIVHNYICFI